MHRLSVSLVLVLAFSLVAAPAAAQQPAPPDARPQVQIDRLPISVERIQRKLAELPPTTKSSPLRLVFYVDVYGKAPPIDLFTNFDLKNGAVPWGAPTHQDFLRLVTPQEFRSPPADFTALFAWLAQQLAKRQPSSPR